MITHNPDERTGGTTVLFKRDRMQARREACPGSTVEHVMKGTGIYVLHIPPDCAGGEARGEEAAA
jgi:hypothetical protein